MLNRLLLILLLGLLLVIGIVMLPRMSGTIGNLTSNEFSSLAVNVTLAVFVGAIVLTLFRERLSTAFLAALLWTGIALAALTGYAYRIELRNVSDRVLSELIPGRATTQGRTVEINRSRAGDFSVAA